MSSKNGKQLAEEFKKKSKTTKSTSLKLKSENKALQETVDKLLAEIENLRGLAPSNLIITDISPEQEIVDQQINLLNAISRQRQLTLDETRALDIHLKNKRMMEKKDPEAIEAEYRNLSKGLTEDDIMRIALNGKTEDPDSETSS